MVEQNDWDMTWGRIYKLDDKDEILEGINELISSGVNLETKYKERDADYGYAKDNYYTPLLFASKRNLPDWIAPLVEHGADVNATDSDGLTVLDIIASTGNADVLDALINAGVDVKGEAGQQSLLNAAYNGNTEVAHKLIDAGVQIDLKKENVGEFMHEFGTKALMRAVKNGDSDLASCLIEAGADVNAKDEDGKTLLMNAVPLSSMHPELMQSLIDHGADLNTQDTRFNYTALMYAAEKGQRQATEILLRSGADVDIIGRRFNRTALDIAVAQGNSDIVDMLKKQPTNEVEKSSLKRTLEEKEAPKATYEVTGKKLDTTITVNAMLDKYGR